MKCQQTPRVLVGADSMAGFLADRRGNVAVLFGFVAPMLFLAVGVAIDYGDLTRLRTDLQNTADAAALAGARRLLTGNGLSTAQQEANARQTAESHVVSNAPEATREIQASAATRQVLVKLTQDKELIFGGLLGMDKSGVAVTGVAEFTPPDVACMLALGQAEPVGIRLDGSAKVTAPKCTLWANARSTSALQSSGSATAAGRVIGTAGGASGAGFSPAPTTYDRTIDDPFLNRYTPPVSTACQYTGFTVTGGGSAAPMNSGVYCSGLKIGGDVALSAGTYYINNSVFEISGTPNIVGSAVTIVLIGNSYLDWKGGATINLSAPTAGPYQDLIMVSDPSGPALTSTIHGNPATTLTGALNGSIYLPNQQLNLTGNSSFDLANTGSKLVARSFAFTGSSLVKLGSDDSLEIAAITKNLRLTK
jgi:hypothetical protein